MVFFGWYIICDFWRIKTILGILARFNMVNTVLYLFLPIFATFLHMCMQKTKTLFYWFRRMYSLLYWARCWNSKMLLLFMLCWLLFKRCCRVKWSLSHCFLKRYHKLVKKKINIDIYYVQTSWPVYQKLAWFYKNCISSKLMSSCLEQVDTASGQASLLAHLPTEQSLRKATFQCSPNLQIFLALDIHCTCTFVFKETLEF